MGSGRGIDGGQLVVSNLGLQVTYASLQSMSHFNFFSLQRTEGRGVAGTGAGVSHVLWHPCQEAQGLLVSPRPSLWALPKVLDWQQWVAAAFPSKAVPRGDSIPWLELASLTSLGFGSILGCPQSNQICFIYELFAFLKKDTCPEIEQRVLGWLWGLVRGPERHIYCMMLSLGPAQKHGTSRALD